MTPNKSIIPHKFRLRTTLVIPFVLQIVGAVGLVGYFSFRNGQQVVNDLASQLQKEISFRVEERIRIYLESPQLVNQINEDAVRLGTLDFNNLESARTYLWKQVLRFKSIGHAGLANEKGQYLRVGWVNRSVGSEQPQLAQQLKLGTGDLIYYKLDNNGNPIEVAKIVPNYDVRKRPLYTAVLKNNRAAWSDVYINFGYGSLQINASAPYYDEQGNFLGIFTSQMGLDQIHNFLRTLKVGKSGQVFLIEPSGELIAASLANQSLTVGKGDAQKRLKAQESSNPIMRQSMEYLKERFRDLNNIQDTTQLVFKLNGQKQFLVVSPLKDEYGLHWLTVVVVPEADFMKQINDNTRNTILLCLGALGLAIALGILTARWITRPIENITRASENMTEGSLDQHVKSSPIVEVDRLGKSFNSMAGQLKESFENLEEKVKERTTELANANAEIAALNARLKAENLRMGSELDILKQMQQMILPKPEELKIKGLDIAGFMEPADEVGGDYYDVLETDDIVTIGMGDVTGHGLESGILMLMTQTAVRTLKEIREHDPVTFLATLNRTIYKNVQRMNSQKNLTLVVLNYAESKVSISGQHEEIIVVRNKGKLERIDTMDLGFPIGLTDEISDFINQIVVELNHGDGIVLYTDGITEAMNMSKNQYGLEQLCEIIQQNWDRSAEEIKQIIIKDVRQHIGSQKVFDDITLLVLKRI
ncbi:serine/threonine protein phosphatase [[Phormidium ambiguum] IAM M-71]|uniref:Serine/threonine protein phosphatase n=1 Tax=[Phormidium ambiguum] IAM M-71 TaxID=454136 RepID=A0A1U7IU38_9CYAN|nr:SpoIIE family protein phosphatase [Phormidium ambiguum]OKH40995.1 serine/threonine protein phosphatase [Phormidium ambiguum IAM M-71]